MANRWRLVLIVAIASLHLFMAMACALREDDLSAYNEVVEPLDAGNSILAEQQFKLGLQKNPDLAETHLNLGLLYLEQGWLEGSQESTMKAIRIVESTRKTVVKGSTYEQPLSLAYNNLGAIEAQRVVTQS